MFFSAKTKNLRSKVVVQVTVDSKGQVFSLLTDIKLEIWIHCVCQVPEGSGVKLQRKSIFSLPNSLSSNVVVVKLLQNRALLVWYVQGLC